MAECTTCPNKNCQRVINLEIDVYRQEDQLYCRHCNTKINVEEA